MRARRLIVPLTLSLTFVGCKREIVKETSGPDPTVTFETEVPPTDSETEIPPLETAETGETDTETEPVETGEPGPLWSDATLTPSGVVVGAGARLPLTRPKLIRGSARMSRTRMRGLRLLNGSWNTTCMSRRTFFISSRAIWVAGISMIRPVVCAGSICWTWEESMKKIPSERIFVLNFS